MKKLLAILWLTVSFAYAQDQSTPNLITSGTTHTWTGVTTGSVPTGCATAGPCPGGPSPIYDPSTNMISFSYNANATVAQSIAVNNALANAGAGIRITGYNYSYDVRNMNGDNRQGGIDTLNVYQYLTSTTGAMLLSSQQTYNTKFEWQSVTGAQTANTPIDMANASRLNFKMVGGDNGYWGGYFGPQVRNVNMSLRYAADVCASDPLSSTSCAGYATAYLNLQCSGNPLYSPQCPGYAQAYFTQQCTVNSLYDPSCPGYANAYLNYQCSINPLYATTCVGYETAHFNQQCSQNPLYSTRCSGYDQAYFTQQCSVNGLYSTSCSNYATAYAKKMLLEQQGLATTVATAGTVAKTAEVANAATTTATTSDGSSSVAVAVVADPIVNAAVTTTATSTSPAAAATATVSLAPAPAPATEVKATATTSAPPPPAPMEKPSQPSARQQLAERRQEAAKKDAVEKGKNLANEMGKAADMESQKQVQNVVIQAMGYTPGFDTYGKVLVPDAIGYKPFTVYNNQKNVDNKRLGMGLYGPSDRLHNDLVGSQYKE
jgi:hypothetical protein